MNEIKESKKTILFLLNGFGLEAPKSFNVYTSKLMPNLDQISHVYPFTSLYTSGLDAGLSKHQIGNFRSNYLSFSTEGKILRKEEIIRKKISSGEATDNKVIMDTLNYVLANNSKLHVMFSIGNKYDEIVYKQLKDFCDFCINKGIKEICLHLFIGDNTNNSQKTATNCLNSLKYHVLGDGKNIRVVAVANKNLLTGDVDLEEKRNLYRMIVSGIGEVWSDYNEFIERKYKANLSDDDIKYFLVKRENVLKDKDAVFFFNYDNNLGKDYLDIIEHNFNYFPMGKLPTGVKVASLFQIYDSKIEYSYENELPDSYFLKDIGENKKILVLAAKNRIGYIVNSLNGFRKEYKSNINVLPIDVSDDRFNQITKYLLAYQNQNMYDLIIADYDLFNEKDNQDVATLKKNMNTVDGCLGAVFNKAQEMGQDLIITSLYGTVGRINLIDREFVNINFSEKSPLIITGKGIDRSRYDLAGNGSIANLAGILYSQLGYESPKSLFTEKGVKKANGKKKLNPMILVAIALIAILGLVFVYAYINGYI